MTLTAKSIERGCLREASTAKFLDAHTKVFDRVVSASKLEVLRYLLYLSCLERLFSFRELQLPYACFVLPIVVCGYVMYGNGTPDLDISIYSVIQPRHRLSSKTVTVMVFGMTFEYSLSIPRLLTSPFGILERRYSLESFDHRSSVLQTHTITDLFGHRTVFLLLLLISGADE